MCILAPSLVTIAHLLIGFFFAFSGFWNIYHWRPIAEDLAQKNIPLPFLVLASGIFWETVGGFMILLGIYVKVAALVLIPFTLISICIFHPFWKHRGELRALNFALFLTHSTITVGVLLLLANNITPLLSFSGLVN